MSCSRRSLGGREGERNIGHKGWDRRRGRNVRGGGIVFRFGRKRGEFRRRQRRNM